MGVVGIVAPDAGLPRPGLAPAPVIVSGNAAVVLLSEKYPLVSLEFAEILATSDLPAGVREPDLRAARRSSSRTSRAT